MRSIWALVLGLCAASVGAQSAPSPQSAQSPQSTRPAPAKPLDLRVGNVARYLPPGEAARLQSDRPPVAAVDTVVVEGQRERVPDPSKIQVPGGPAGLIWGLFHPTQAWRLLAPDPNARPAEPPRSDRAPAVPRIGCGPGTNKTFCD